MTAKPFNEENILRKLRHYLPAQTPLKDFIHHNSLHAFQNLKFYDAIFKASKIFGYNVTLQLSEYRQLYKNGRIKEEILYRQIIQKKGEENKEKWKKFLVDKTYEELDIPRIGGLRSEWKAEIQTDLDALVQPLLFRILCSYLDQGIALWSFPLEKTGFLDSLKELEKNQLVSFFKTKRARQLLLNNSCEIESLLKILVEDKNLFDQYLFDQQFSHQGWSGLVSAIEDQPQSLYDRRKISLREMIILELLLEIDALDHLFGESWRPLGKLLQNQPEDLFKEIANSELNEVLTIWQNAFEWSYYDEALAGIQLNKKRKRTEPESKSFQAIFCIDERECSIRRHIEAVDRNCQTLGTPGFFGVEFYFQPENGKFYDKLCPAPVTPKYLIKEFNVKEKRKHEPLYTKHAHTFFAGFVITITMGFLSAIKILLNLFRPQMSPAISNAFTHVGKNSQLTIENKNPVESENGLQIGFTIEEMATRVESQLRGMGILKNFSKLIYVIAHGSSSANNPHHAAHDCGACSGRPGSVNSRVFSFMANHLAVRKILASRGIDIPAGTTFIAGLHDTAADVIAFYDIENLSPDSIIDHQKNMESFEKALDLNAKERSRRFASINSRQNLKKVREAIRKRSVSLFEPRPELGHGTNTLCIVGGRNLTKGLFLDRRAFMNSYDHRTDPEGTILAGIMKPLGPVCGGINLEYYFSRIDNHKLGAGTKLPHNVMGLVGVANSCDGDLRPGLPLQMIEAHDPVRLLIIVEHFPEIVLKTIQSTPEMYEWFINEWVHLVAVNPENHSLFYFKTGAFVEYSPVTSKIDLLHNITGTIENAMEMVTNEIAEATKENLPVYLIN